MASNSSRSNDDKKQLRYLLFAFGTGDYYHHCDDGWEDFPRAFYSIDEAVAWDGLSGYEWFHVVDLPSMQIICCGEYGKVCDRPQNSPPVEGMYTICLPDWDRGEYVFAKLVWREGQPRFGEAMSSGECLPEHVKKLNRDDRVARLYGASRGYSLDDLTKMRAYRHDD